MSAPEFRVESDIRPHLLESPIQIERIIALYFPGDDQSPEMVQRRVAARRAAVLAGESFEQPLGVSVNIFQPRFPGTFQYTVWYKDGGQQFISPEQLFNGLPTPR